MKKFKDTSRIVTVRVFLAGKLMYVAQMTYITALLFRENSRNGSVEITIED